MAKFDHLRKTLYNREDIWKKLKLKKKADSV